MRSMLGICAALRLGMALSIGVCVVLSGVGWMPGLLLSGRMCG